MLINYATRRSMFFSAILTALCIGAFIGTSFAQSEFILSKNADFSTDDRVFTRGDTLYMMIVAPDIDYTDIDKNEFRLQPDSGGDDFEGQFTNMLNGTYIGSVALDAADPQEDDWRWRGRIRDKSGNEFETDVPFRIVELQNNEIEVVGVVTNVDASTITVTGLIFQVNEQTEVLDQENNPIALGDVRIGFIVQIRADVLEQQIFLATKIKIQDFFEDQLEVMGVIEELGQESLTVAGFEFLVTSETEVLDDDGNLIDFTELQVGLFVQIKALVRVDRTIAATRIKVEDRFSDEVELTGTIDALDTPFISVAGIVFEVTGETEILDNDGNPISFGDLQVGQLVQVKGVVQLDGSLLAVRIKLEDRIEDEVEITGIIEHITDVSITVLGRTFGITENTVVFDDNDNLISLGDLFVGQTVEVRGDLMPDGTLIAIRIKLEDREADEIEVVGPIESFGAGTLEVVGIHFFVTENTEILDEDNNAIQLGDLAIGQTVEIRALGQPNGPRIATRIRVEDLLLLSGSIDQVVFNGISVVGKEVLFDANTLILGKLNIFLSVKDLKVGQFVEIRGERGEDNVVLSTKIKVQGEIITSVELAPDQAVPQTFILRQNYPNPFNPATTITFRVPRVNQSAVRTKLTIYNLLGQTIRTLVDEPLQAGQTYQAHWDATDDHGIQQASGVYLYRLKAGNFTETRRMILMK